MNPSLAEGFFMRKKYSFDDFKKKIPFLKEIPQTIALQLSVDEFYFPDRAVDDARNELEKVFNHYVMSYKADVFYKKVPLCIINFNIFM